MVCLIAVQVSTEMSIYGRSLSYTMAFLLPVCAKTFLAADALRLLLKAPVHICDSRQISYFAVVAIAGSTFVGALVGALVVTSFFSVADYWRVWQIWWFADALGVLIAAAPILACFLYQNDQTDRYRAIAERSVEIGI